MNTLRNRTAYAIDLLKYRTVSTLLTALEVLSLYTSCLDFLFVAYPMLLLVLYFLVVGREYKLTNSIYILMDINECCIII